MKTEQYINITLGNQKKKSTKKHLIYIARDL